VPWTATVRIAFAVWLVLANAWCVTACTFLPCQPVRTKSDLPPCHRAPAEEHQTDNCSHPVIAFADSLTVQPADALSMPLAPAALPESLTFSPLLVSFAIDLHSPGPALDFRPPSLTVLRI
jgi:hypothetical protein